MKTIHKWALPDNPCTIAIPKGAVLVHFESQRGNPTLWAIVDPEAPPEAREFLCVGTGQEIPEGYEYIATCQAGSLVWHLLEKPSSAQPSGA